MPPILNRSAKLWKIFFNGYYCYQTRAGQELIYLRPACSVWGLTLCRKDFTGDFESMFIKAGDSETKEGVRLEEATEESLGGALLWNNV